MNIAEAAAQLENTLLTLQKVRYGRLGGTVHPPTVIVGAPSLVWEYFGEEATTATFSVFLVVSQDERALENLLSNVEEVARVIERITGAVILRAAPGVYASGSQDLPCYTFSVEMSL